MTETQHTAKKPKAPPAQTAKPVRQPGRLLSLLALLLALTAAAGGGYLWYQQKKLSTEQFIQITDLKRQLRALNEHSALIELKQRVLDQDSHLSAAIAEQQAKINALQQAFEVTRNVVNRDQRGWILAEVEYLLRLAITRLQLTYDINGATQALIAADQRLNDLADPSVLQVRKALSAEITALKSLPQPDIDGAALQLLSIANRLHLLPQAKRPATAQIAAEKETTAEPVNPSFWAHAWNRLKASIGLRGSDAPRTASAIQAELYYIDQLLRFELEAARQAVLRLHKEEFNKRLSNARKLLDEHYDRNHEHIIRIRGELAALQDSNLIPALPDISGSLLELRKLMAKHPSPVSQDNGST